GTVERASRVAGEGAWERIEQRGPVVTAVADEEAEAALGRRDGLGEDGQAARVGAALRHAGEHGGGQPAQRAALLAFLDQQADDTAHAPAPGWNTGGRGRLL